MPSRALSFMQRGVGSFRKQLDTILQETRNEKEQSLMRQSSAFLMPRIYVLLPRLLAFTVSSAKTQAERRKLSINPADPNHSNEQLLIGNDLGMGIDLLIDCTHEATGKETTSLWHPCDMAQR